MILDVGIAALQQLVVKNGTRDWIVWEPNSAHPGDHDFRRRTRNTSRQPDDAEHLSGSHLNQAAVPSPDLDGRSKVNLGSQDQAKLLYQSFGFRRVNLKLAEKFTLVRGKDITSLT